MNMMSSFVEYKELQNNEPNGKRMLVNRRLLCSGIVLGVLAVLFFTVYLLSSIL